MDKPPVDAEFKVVAEPSDPRVDIGIIVAGVAGFLLAGWAGVSAMEHGRSAAFSHGIAGGCAVAVIASARSLIAHLRHRRRQVSPDHSGRTTHLQERILDDL